jgi:multidrug efflux system membrane fusion protein
MEPSEPSSHAEQPKSANVPTGTAPVQPPKALPAAEERKLLQAPHDRTGAAASPAAHRRRRRWIFWTALIVGILLIILIATRMIEAHRKAEDAKKLKAAPIPVSVATARQGDLGVHLDALGVVTPLQTVTVHSRVSGELKEIHFTEGQLVRQGDLLAVIDPDPFEAALTQSTGQLARDQAQLENARIDLTRYENAFKERAISEQQVATQRALVQQDEGTVKSDEGGLRNAQIQLAYTHITSPLAGRVGLRLVDLGNLVNPTDANGLLVITQLQPITVVFSVAEDYVGQIAGNLRNQQAMPVTALDRDQQKSLAEGSVLTIDNQIDTTTGTVKLKADFPNADSALFPNQFVNARLLLQTLHGATLVPVAAIQRNNQDQTIFVVGADHKAQSRKVTTAAIDGDTAAVTGVNPGDAVVTDGFDKLQNGTPVEIRPNPPPAGAPAAAPAAGSASTPAAK